MPLVLPCRCPSEEGPPFPENGRFDALALRVLEILGVREIDVVRTTPADSPEDFEVRLPELVIVIPGISLNDNEQLVVGLPLLLQTVSEIPIKYRKKSVSAIVLKVPIY